MLPLLQIGNFVYIKLSPYQESAPWLYGLVTAILASISTLLKKPADLIKWNRAHLHPAVLPPPCALIERMDG